MADMESFLIFVGALAVAYLIPGPDMVLILQTGALQERRQALATAAGFALARALHVALAALGLAALLRTAPMVFETVRMCGAAYLVWLGIAILRSRSSAPDADMEERTRSSSARSAAVRGLLTNLLNPKALLFCSVLLPQFIQPEQGAIAGQFLLLGTILVCVGLAFDLLYAGAGSFLGRWIARHPIVQIIQRWTFATLLIGFGLRLAFTNRPT
ncbi:LysE family translocator [Pseudoroseomonas globiformis]|uniref:LysE family translocator n=1 Tax=Teichococcus globiformis TaxID=2307229 RepID=A0ABV7G6M6_9PROT